MAEQVSPSLLALKVMRRMREGYIESLKRQKEAYTSGPGALQAPQPPGPPPAQPSRKRQGEGIEMRGKSGSMAEMPPITKTDTSDLKNLNIVYPLIPREPSRDEKVYAYADIRWSKKQGEVIYYVVEPQISKLDTDLMASTMRVLEERLDINFFKLGEIKAKALLDEEIRKNLSDYSMPAEKMDILRYYLQRDVAGMGKIEPLMNDPNIEDISCDGVNIPIYVYHRDPKLGSLKTNVAFSNGEELNYFVIKMAQRCKKSISIAEPLLDASLPDGSRVQATLGTDIARKGSNFTVRRFSEQPLTPCHMLKYGTLNSVQLAYLWLAVENGQSILISGGTATGKTSMLNALSLFMRPNLKIVSIEDTPELRLPHPHWIPEVARSPISIEGSIGEVSLFDLLKSSLRQRPDYIVMGEVRGKEAFVLFQQMATGHPSLATIHAASINQLVDRLTTAPISLPPALIENVNIIVFLALSRLGGRYVRRASDILEIVGVEGDRPLTNRVFAWHPGSDKFETDKRSLVLREICRRLGFSESELRDELERRKRILEWMYEQRIFDYREVARVISTYYTNPKRVIDTISERS